MNNSGLRRLPLALACAAGCIVPPALAEDPILADATPAPAQITGYVYINARTGEWTISTAPTVSRSEMIPRFVNEDTASNGSYFYGIDNPTVSGLEVANWGDVEFDTTVDAFRFSYATNIVAPGPGDIVPGLDATIWWCDCDNGFADPNLVPLWNVSIEDLAGVPNGETGWAGYVYTVDLDGSGLEFEIGDTDGSFTGVTGASSTGCDRDDSNGDPLADFSWSYRFPQGQAGPIGTIGPMLVLPAYAAVTEDDGLPTGADGDARGVDDAFEIYRNPAGGTHEVLVGTYWLGGWPAAPYASTFIGLYGSNPRDCGPADFNADTTVDVLDFLDFIDDFSNCENQPAPCGSIANADLGGDTIVDILDFLDFMDVFGACE
jgi:hypothetical protein